MAKFLQRTSVKFHLVSYFRYISQSPLLLPPLPPPPPLLPPPPPTLHQDLSTPP
jgi:hypothetical protein